MANPNWLDEERRLLQIYRSAPPESLCPCRWEEHHEPGEQLGVWRLTERKVSCPIHGRHGTH